jgi:hypothetical protein
MMKPLALVLALLLAAACGSVDAGDPEPGEDSPDAAPGDHTGDADGGPTDDADPGDPDRPAVVSVTPADGAAGVRSGANITVVFDREMDADSVEAAWSSELLPAGAVTFSWNPAGDTLTVNPADPLPLAEGEGLDPDVVDPIAVAYAIGTGATDVEGNALAAALEVDFTTARRMTVELGRNGPLSGSQESDGGSPPIAGDIFYSGDTGANLGVRMLISFALPDLPDGAELVAATLSAEQVFASTNVFGVLGGGLEAVRVRFAQLTGAYDAGDLGSLGIFSSSAADGTRSLPVTSAVRDDLADGVTYSQFRFEFPLATDSDGLFDSLQFTRDSFALAMTYLVD